jgi:hypothetical protein
LDNDSRSYGCGFETGGIQKHQSIQRLEVALFSVVIRELGIRLLNGEIAARGPLYGSGVGGWCESDGEKVILNASAMFISPHRRCFRVILRIPEFDPCLRNRESNQSRGEVHWQFFFRFARLVRSRVRGVPQTGDLHSSASSSSAERRKSDLPNKKFSSFRLGWRRHLSCR